MPKKKNKSAPSTSLVKAEPILDPPDCSQVRQLIRQLVVAAAGEMVEAAIERAKTGHDQIIKYLFELAGLYPELAQQTGLDDDFSLARTLCDRLGLPPAPEDAPALTEPEILDPADPTTGRGNGHALK